MFLDGFIWKVLFLGYSWCFLVIFDGFLGSLVVLGGFLLFSDPSDGLR